MISNSRTRALKYVLAGMSLSGLDRLYQQLDSERGFILMLHRVCEKPSCTFHPNAHLSIKPRFLEQVLDLIVRRGIEVISMDEVGDHLASKSSSGRFCAITFDDAYCDTLTEAAPILRRYNAPFTVYVASGLVAGTAHLWWEKLEDLIRVNTRLRLDFGDGVKVVPCESQEQKLQVWRLVMDFLTEACPELETAHWFGNMCRDQEVALQPETPGEVMSWADVRTLNADPLCTIGSHTVSHYALARLPEETMHAEIRECGKVLREQIGSVPKHFAYPYGYPLAAGAREFKATRDLGFETAVTTRTGMLFSDHREYLTALPRISVNGYFQNLRHFAPLTSGLPTRLKSGFRRLDVA